MDELAQVNAKYGGEYDRDKAYIETIIDRQAVEAAAKKKNERGAKR